MPMVGGYVSDRFLGNRNCILLGGLTMAAGQFLLFASGAFYDASPAVARNCMWAALAALIFGNGFFKPNISSMVGQLYPKGDGRLDAAFTIFYLGINLGAFLGITICPILGDVLVKDAAGNETRVVTAFKWGFFAAGVAMLLGVAIFQVLKGRYLVSPEGAAVGARPRFGAVPQKGEKAQFAPASVAKTLLAVAGMTLGFHWLLADPRAPELDPIAWIYGAIYASGLGLAGLILTDKSLERQERDRILVLYAVAFFVMFFWACFEQAGSSLTFIAANQTDRNLFGWDMPPSLVQNANSLFIIVFAFPFSALWIWLQRRGREPISPVKQAWGLALLALGSLIMGLQVKDLGATEKVGVAWLIVMYFFHTIGELCLSPIGLSLVSKLAPQRFASLLMGVWFLANAAGYALAGTLGAMLPPTGDKYEAARNAGIDLPAVLEGRQELTDALRSQLEALKLPSEYPVFAGFQITNLFEFFLLLVILPGAAAALLFAISPVLKRMMHGVK
jgi:POT family proton-dependent oligopeptide transporter